MNQNSTDTLPLSPPPTLPAETVRHLQWLFAYHVLTIRQKLLTISQKYTVNDEYERPRFFVVRPPRIMMNVLAGMASTIIRLLALLQGFRILLGTQDYVTALLFVIGGSYLSLLVRILLTPYRDIRVYTDESEQFQVLLLTQDNKFGLHHWFTILDAVGQPVARARRNFIVSLWRRQWVAETLDGREICRVREDSLALALLRRYIGTLWGALRTNFDLLFPDGSRAGEYNRKLTITDQYILDLRQDPTLLIDRRVTLALAILLDTAEGR
jgi:hypothetical protein